MTKKRLSTAILLTLSLSLTACSAKPSADTVETSTEIQEETKTSVTDADTSSNDADTSSNDAGERETGEAIEPSTEEETLTESDEEESTEEETEDKTEDSPESKTNAASESEEEEEIESESTNSKTSEKDSTKSETTTSETTTEAVTVQSVSAVVNGTHYVGETLTGVDFTVTVTMSDGETLTNPAGWSAQPLTLNSTSNLITISYQGASVTITVEASVQETTAATVASNTTTTTTTKAETTQAATTQAETTTAATTTAAETTTASYTYSPLVELEDGDYNYDFAQALFIAQNEMRAETGADALIWDDQMYEIAKQCAKVCGDNGVLDHDLTAQYRTGQAENLQTSAFGCYVEDEYWYSVDASYCIESIKKSELHYKAAIQPAFKYGAIAVYKMGDTTYISYLFDVDMCISD